MKLFHYSLFIPRINCFAATIWIAGAMTRMRWIISRCNPMAHFNGKGSVKPMVGRQVRMAADRWQCAVDLWVERGTRFNYLASHFRSIWQSPPISGERDTSFHNIVNVREKIKILVQILTVSAVIYNKITLIIYWTLQIYLPRRKTCKIYASTLLNIKGAMIT